MNTKISSSTLLSAVLVLLTVFCGLNSLVLLKVVLDLEQQSQPDTDVAVECLPTDEMNDVVISEKKWQPKTLLPDVASSGKKWQPKTLLPDPS